MRVVAVAAAAAAPGIDFLFEIGLALLDGGPRADAGVQRESQQGFVSIHLVRGGSGDSDEGEEEVLHEAENLINLTAAVGRVRMLRGGEV